MTWTNPVISDGTGWRATFRAFREGKKTLHNDFAKVIFTEACPNCGISIDKAGGCSHMVCQRCKFEFCWSCLGSYKGYLHQENTHCPLKKVVAHTMILILTILVNIKLSYSSSTYKHFIYMVMYWILICIASNIWVVTTVRSLY